MDKCCLMLRAIILTSVRIIGLWSLSSPPAWTSVAQATFVKLFKVDMLSVLQARYNMSGKGSLWIWQLYPFMIVGGCIKDICYVLSLATSMCGAHAVLLHTCHSWSAYVLELWCMGEWGCIVVQNFRAPLQLLPVTEESVSSLNGWYVWF